MQDIRFRLILSFVFAVCLNFVISPSAPAADLPTPKWVWTDAESPRSREAFFRRTFDVTGEVTAAELTGVADFCRIDLYLNGERVGEIADFSPKFQIDVTDQIGSGRNVLAVGARSHAGPAAIALRLRLKFRDGSEQFYITDEDWRANSTASADWNRTKPSAADWPKAVELGELASEPWGDHADTLSINELDDYTQWKQALEQPEGTAPTNFFVLPGFRIDLVHSAQPEEGSWISLAFDPQGRVVIAREDSGLLRLTLNAENSKSISVETINETLKECRGLLFAHDGLYANANNSKGLYRLRDTNGDDQFNEVKLLRETPGEKGHGRNDLAFGPDGAIYAIHGDSVETPEDIPSRLSPFRQNSHPGRRGFVMRSDPDGNHMEIVTSGLRNPYGIDFNVDGEMFTYDADAEYDMGAPWYRPTRVLHLLPGGDYGWRAVTRSWPPYDPDRADAAVPNFDVGKGSPTAVKFGTKSHFPPKYRRALFALDWSYGRILAVHMTPRGGSYAMRAETFLKGRPFNVTDLGFGPDGAMYVVTGGRKTQAGLYRVSYVGDLPAEPKPTIQQAARAKYSATARTTRHRLEEFQQRNDPAAVDLAWDYLDSPDPALRYAARIAVEHQPLDQWRERAVEETRTQALLTALLALAQGCEADEFPRIINRLADVPIDKLPDGQQIIVLRIFELVLARDKNGSPEFKAEILRKLDPLFPATSTAVNFHLCELLVSLQATDVIPRTLELLAGAATQEEQFQYIHVLRNVRKGWTPES